MIAYADMADKGNNHKRLLDLPRDIWKALDEDAKRCKRTSQKQLEAILSAYFRLNAVELGDLTGARNVTSPDLAREIKEENPLVGKIIELPGGRSLREVAKEINAKTEVKITIAQIIQYLDGAIILPAYTVQVIKSGLANRLDDFLSGAYRPEDNGKDFKVAEKK